MKKKTFNLMSSKELCEALRIKDVRSILSTDEFPNPIFEEKHMMFDKKEVLKYFNIENFKEPFITTKEAADYLNVSNTYISYLALSDRIPSYKLKSTKGSGYLFRKSELDVFRKTDIKGNISFIDYFVGNEIMRNIFLNYIDIFKDEVTTREHEVVYEYFFNRKTFSEIGEKFELTYSRVHSIFQKAMNRFNRKLSTKNMLHIGKLERTLIQKDVEIKYLRGLIEEKSISNDENKVHFDEYKKLRLCIEFLEKKFRSEEDLTIRAVNILDNISMYDIYSFLIEFNTYKKNTRDIIKFRNVGRKTYLELIDYIKNKEKEFEIVTGVSSEEFFSDRPKTPENLSLFSKIHANFKN